jgi:hypothetical protein
MRLKLSALLLLVPLASCRAPSTDCARLRSLVEAHEDELGESGFDNALGRGDGGASKAATAASRSAERLAKQAADLKLNDAALRARLEEIRVIAEKLQKEALDASLAVARIDALTVELQGDDVEQRVKGAGEAGEHVTELCEKKLPLCFEVLKKMKAMSIAIDKTDSPNALDAVAEDLDHLKLPEGELADAVKDLVAAVHAEAESLRDLSRKKVDLTETIQDVEKTSRALDATEKLYRAQVQAVRERCPR